MCFFKKMMILSGSWKMIMKDKDLDIAMCMFAIVSGLGIPIILLIRIAKKLGVIE